MLEIERCYHVIAQSPLDFICLEEYLVNSISLKDKTLLFYINPPSVIIGRNQNYWREVSPSCQVPVYRRVSGGGAVYHDFGNLNWSLIVPRDQHSQEEELSSVAHAISKMGIRAYPGERGGLFVVMSDGENEGKISGTARRFGTRYVLHHGTLLISSDIEALKASLGGVQIFEDSSIPSILAHPVNLTDFIPSLTVKGVMDAISLSLSGQKPRMFDIATSFHKNSSNAMEARYETDLFIRRDEFLRMREDFGSKQWILGRTPPFSVLISNGLGKAVVRVREGQIDQIVPYEDTHQPSVEYSRILSAQYHAKSFNFEAKELMERASA